MINRNFRILTLLASMTAIFSLALTPAHGEKTKSEKKNEFPNFAPGKYSLKEGEDKYCGEGKFYVEEDKEVIWIGPYYGFKTKPGVETSEAGLDISKGCTNISKTEITSKLHTTTIKATHTLRCGKSDRQVLTNTATITKSKISLEQTQVVDPKFYDQIGGAPHSCVWVPSK